MYAQLKVNKQADQEDKNKLMTAQIFVMTTS